VNRPGPGRKKVTAENLARLGADRLAEILVTVAETRPDLKRRLRMELAADLGVEPLLSEIDRRLATLESSRGKVSWRQRPAFGRDLDALRGLIGERLAALDRGAALSRLWIFLELWPRIQARTRDREGALEATFVEAARGLGRLLSFEEVQDAAPALLDALQRAPQAWAKWLPAALEGLPQITAATILTSARVSLPAMPSSATLVRLLADAAHDPDAYVETFTAVGLKTSDVAAAAARRYLDAGRIEEAGALLRNAAPHIEKGEPDAAWESAWIDYLEAAGLGQDAQDVRWASFERTLSVTRARDYIARLPDFEDVEAEHRALDVAAGHRNADRGLALLMDWPALPEAARMIEARVQDLKPTAEEAELWASRLRRRHPVAAHALLRRAAALAFGRREYKTCERLTEEAETIALS
jgi:hypothetical protein